MIIIPSDLIEEIEADSEDSEFPATNMADNHCRKSWVTADGVTSATVNLKTIGAAANALCIYYLLGDSATITVYDDVNLAGSVIYGPTAHDLLETNSYFANEVQVPGVWVEYTGPGAPHSAKIEITRTGDRPEIGRAFAGKKWALTKNPTWGLGRNPEDHSIIYDLDNGFEYIYKRNIRRIYEGNLELTGNPPTEFLTFMNMVELLGPTPVPVLMAQNVTPVYPYVFYGRISNVKGTEAKYNLSTVSFTLKEFL